MASVRSIPRISALLSYARIVSCAPSTECIRQEIVVSIFTSVAIYSSFRLPHPIGTNSSLITIFPVQVTRGCYGYMGRQSISKNHILPVDKISGSSPDRGANHNSNAERLLHISDGRSTHLNHSRHIAAALRT